MIEGVPLPSAVIILVCWDEIVSTTQTSLATIAMPFLHAHLENIERVAGDRPERTSGTSGGELLQERRVLRRRAAERDLARLVQAEAKGRVAGLAEPGGVDPLPHRERALVRHHALDRPSHPKRRVLRRDLYPRLFRERRRSEMMHHEGRKSQAVKAKRPISYPSRRRAEQQCSSLLLRANADSRTPHHSL